MIEQSKKKLEEGKTSLEVKLGYGMRQAVALGGCLGALLLPQRLRCAPENDLHSSPCRELQAYMLCALAPCALRSWTQRWASCGPAA